MNCRNFAEGGRKEYGRIPEQRWEPVDARRSTRGRFGHLASVARSEATSRPLRPNPARPPRAPLGVSLLSGGPYARSFRHAVGGQIRLPRERSHAHSEVSRTEPVVQIQPPQLGNPRRCGTSPATNFWRSDKLYRIQLHQFKKVSPNHWSAIESPTEATAQAIQIPASEYGRPYVNLRDQCSGQTSRIACIAPGFT